MATTVTSSAYRRTSWTRRPVETAALEPGDATTHRFEDLDLRARIGHMILAADHMRDAQVDVVDHRRQRIKIAAVGADRRLDDGDERRVRLGAAALAHEALGPRRGVVRILRRQIRADDRPCLAAIEAAHQVVAAEINDLRVVRREVDRRRPVPAVGQVARCASAQLASNRKGLVSWLRLTTKLSISSSVIGCSRMTS